MPVGEILTDDDRNHWSFQPIERPALPAVKDVAICTTPIDHFLLAKLEAIGRVLDGGRSASFTAPVEFRSDWFASLSADVQALMQEPLPIGTNGMLIALCLRRVR